MSGKHLMNILHHREDLDRDQETQPKADLVQLHCDHEHEREQKQH